MPTPNTTNSIQLSAISNLNPHDFQYNPYPSNPSEPDGYTTEAKDKAYDDLIALGKNGSNEIYLEASIPNVDGSYTSTKISLYKLIEAIATYTKYIDTWNAKSNDDGYLKVNGETRPWRPTPTNGSSIIVPLLSSNSSNNVGSCNIFRVKATAGSNDTKGLCLQIRTDGSILIHAAVAHNSDQSATTDGSRCFFLNNDQINMTARGGTSISAAKSTGDITNTNNILGKFVISKGTTTTNNEYANVRADANTGIVILNGYGVEGKNTPIVFNSFSSASNVAIAQKTTNGVTDNYGQIQCTATRAKWA